MTKSERELMRVLWNSDEPLTCVQIVERSEGKKWQDSYVHIMVRSLLKQGLIKVDGFELVSKSYARKFAPTMTEDESVVRNLVGEDVWSKDRVPAMFTAFVEKEATLESLDEFEKIINARKNELLGEAK